MKSRIKGHTKRDTIVVRKLKLDEEDHLMGEIKPFDMELTATNQLLMSEANAGTMSTDDFAL